MRGKSAAEAVGAIGVTEGVHGLLGLARSRSVDDFEDVFEGIGPSGKGVH